MQLKSTLSALIPQNLKNFYHLGNAFLATQKYHHPSNKLKIIAVTGTDGKTTTSTLTYHLLQSAGLRVALISTVAAYIDDQEIETGLHVTSPDPWALQRLLVQIYRKGIKLVVLEVTSHGIDQHRLFGVNPDIAILTNITHEHLDYHKTMDNYIKTKVSLLNRAGLAMINPKLENIEHIKSFLTNQNSKNYTLTKLPQPISQAIITKFPQRYNQFNAAAAATVAKLQGVSTEKIVKGINSFTSIPGRLQPIPNQSGIIAYVDFAHTPNALLESLSYLQTQTRGKLIAVYGAAGLRDREKRPKMGNIGARIADEVILTAEDPRTEPINTILRQMLDGVTTNHAHVHTVPDRQQAINFAVKLAQPGDIVGVFGKGHEKSMCYGTVETPWSDTQALTQALKQYGH